MIKAVIFDMYETLITLFDSPLYFGTQMAADAGIPEEKFQKSIRILKQNAEVSTWKREITSLVLKRKKKQNDRKNYFRGTIGKGTEGK